MVAKAEKSGSRSASDGSTPGDTGRSSNLERTTVNLAPRTVAALNELVKLTGDTKTDIINKAVQIHHYLQGIMNAPGGALYVRESEGAELERLRFF